MDKGAMNILGPLGSTKGSFAARGRARRILPYAERDNLRRRARTTHLEPTSQEFPNMV